MRKALFKKQFLETFRAYFVNAKTGKARKKGAIIGLFCGFGLLFVVLYGAFFAMSMGVLDAMSDAGMSWMGMAIMAVISLLLATFGSVFNTFSFLYQAKDNDLLLSMPIRPSTLLSSRLLMVFCLNLLYGSAVWVPAVVAYQITTGFQPVALLLGILMTFVIGLFSMVLTCALGWVIALLASRLKHNSVLTAIIGLTCFGLYYYFCFNASDLITNLAMNAMGFSKGFKAWGFWFTWVGEAACGQVLPALIVTGTTLALDALCLWVMSHTYLAIVTAAPTAGKSKQKLSDGRIHTPNTALLQKEAKRFTSSATYMLNCGLGAVMAIGIAVILLLKLDELRPALTMLQFTAPDIAAIIPAAVPLALGLTLGMDCMSFPSVSLERDTLWLTQSMPLHPRQILRVKWLLHVLVHVPCGIIALLIVEIALGADALTILAGAAFLVTFILFNAKLGLVFGLTHPNLHWTNETQVIKQSLFVLVIMLINMVVALALGAGGYFLRNLMDLRLYLAAASALLLVVGALL